MPSLRINLPHPRMGRIDAYFSTPDYSVMRNAFGLTDELMCEARGVKDEKLVPMVLQLPLEKRKIQNLGALMEEHAAGAGRLRDNPPVSAFSESECSTTRHSSDGIVGSPSCVEQSSESGLDVPLCELTISDSSVNSSYEGDQIDVAQEVRIRRTQAVSVILEGAVRESGDASDIKSSERPQSAYIPSLVWGAQEPELDEDVKLERGRTMDILTGKLNPPRDHDYGNAAPLLKEVFHLYHRMSTRRADLELLPSGNGQSTDLPASGMAMTNCMAEWMRSHLLEHIPFSKRHLFFEWTPELQTLLLELEYVRGDEGIICKVVKVRNLNACCREEFKKVMTRVEARGWRDAIWVMEREMDFPMKVDILWPAEREANEVKLI